MIFHLSFCFQVTHVYFLGKPTKMLETVFYLHCESNHDSCSLEMTYHSFMDLEIVSSFFGEGSLPCHRLLLMCCETLKCSLNILPFSVDLNGSGAVCLRKENLTSVQSNPEKMCLPCCAAVFWGCCSIIASNLTHRGIRMEGKTVIDLGQELRADGVENECVHFS